MDPKLRLMLVASNDLNCSALTHAPRRRRFSAEFDRRGLFMTFGRFDVYLCTEPEAAWSLLRDRHGLDLQFWRLHLIIDEARQEQDATVGHRWRSPMI
ncbi:hypothetical protein [Falsiroseomonas sp. E2-1-a20]|uniref:hypothetical protein n=1 Tax=Falsiroseomonas sp. E2-1-a20 TaxID=3239300 RepID=UPI003F2EF211